eukprot:5113484-Prymnesium_polylepis.1
MIITFFSCPWNISVEGAHLDLIDTGMVPRLECQLTLERLHLLVVWCDCHTGVSNQKSSVDRRTQHRTPPSGLGFDSGWRTDAD